MNTLLLDCGNSRIKWRFASADELMGTAQAVPTRPLDDVVEALNKAVLRTPADRLLAANVAGPAVEEAISVWANRQGMAVDFAAVSTETCGVRCAYKQPQRLGVDRWMALIAAFTKVRAAVCVVSAGTAVTVDVVGPDGVHCGGLILVGSALAAQALERYTARIGPTRSDAGMPAGLGILGRDTDSAVSHGSRLSIAAAVDRTVNMVGVAFGYTPALVLTGGDAERIAPWLEHGAAIEPDLVLRGLLKVGQQDSFSRQDD